ncbi:MAG: hypothetical protein JKY65_31295, partial [Planctomycetes bacterium]|nr:hypothetical protein [Planctomycetota bacterium]
MNPSLRPVLSLLITVAVASLSLAGPRVERTLSDLPEVLPPTAELVIVSEQPGSLRWGVDGWSAPRANLRPVGTRELAGVVETPLRGPGPDGRYRVTLGPFPNVRSLQAVIRHAQGWTHGRQGKDATVRFQAGAPSRRRPITIGRGPRLGTSSGVVHYEDFQDWEHADLVSLDPSDDARDRGDRQTASRDLLALYGRREAGALYLRADLLELGLGDELGGLEVVFLLDWAPGGERWLPDFADGVCAEGWELAIVVRDGQTIDVFDASWNAMPDARRAHFRSDLDALEIGLNEDALRRAGWDGRAPLRLAAYTLSDGDPRLSDAIDEDLSDGVLDTWSPLSGGRARGTAKYSVILHGNQAVQPLRWLDDLIESSNLKTPAGRATGYVRALDAHQLLRVPVNVHVSGTLAATLEWGAPGFNARIRGFLDGQDETGQGALIGGVLAEHIAPYFENARSAHGGEGANGVATRLNDELLERIYGPSPRSVFWIPERVVRGRTLPDVLRDGTGAATGYTFTILDQVTHLARWFGAQEAQASGHKLNRIGGVTCFMINDADDQWKFANSDGGLWLDSRRRLLNKALDPDQEQLTLVFDDWEAFSGRSFTSFGVGNDNPDNYERGLRWIANHPWIQTVTLEQVAGWGWNPVERGAPSQLPLTTYEWLDHATEGSYDDWFYGSAQEESFVDLHLERTPGVYVPKPFGEVDRPGTVLGDVWEAVARAPAGRLRDLAAAVYLVDVFETAWHDEDQHDYLSKTPGGGYAFPDTSFDRVSGWSRAMQARVGDAGVVAAAARWSASPPSGVRVWRADVDEDGELELLLADERAFYAFENDGARLVFAAVRDPATGAAEPFLGTLLNAPGDELSRDREANQEDRVKRAPGLVDWWSSGAQRDFVNEPFASEARPRGWRFRAGGLEKEVSLRDGRLEVRYRCDASLGEVYVRTGLAPASLDLFLGGARLDAQVRGDGAVVASAV